MKTGFADEGAQIVDLHLFVSELSSGGWKRETYPWGGLFSSLGGGSCNKQIKGMSWLLSKSLYLYTNSLSR